MNQASLRVVNNDIIDISCDLVFESTPYLEVKSSPTVLAPGEFQEIPISFLQAAHARSLWRRTWRASPDSRRKREASAFAGQG